MSELEGEAAMQRFMSDVIGWEEQYGAPLTMEARTAIWDAVQESGTPDAETAHRAFHLAAQAIYGEPTTEDGATLDEIEEDDDDGLFLDDDDDDDENIGSGRLAVIEEHLGRQLTAAELARVPAALDAGSWDVERVVADAGLKDFSQMTRDETRDWLSSRVNRSTRRRS